MAKVELTKIRLAVTAITQTIVATIPNKAGTMMLHKHDVSSDFQKCIIDYGANKRWNISAENDKDGEYQVACVKRKGGHKQALFTRTEVVELLAERDALAEKVPLELWIEKKLK